MLRLTELKGFGVMTKLSFLFLCAFGLDLSPANATTYYVDDVSGSAFVNGSITTDGTIGNLATGNITAWNLTLYDGANTALLIGSNSTVNFAGSPSLTATPSELDFDFSATSPPQNVFYFVGNSLAAPFFSVQASVTVGSFTSQGGVSWNANVLSDGSAQLFFSGVAPIAETPLPAALPLFATGLGALGLLGWRRKRKNAAIAA
jgi:hypothetical protein